MQTVSELLKLMEEKGAKDDQNLYSVVAGGYFLSHKPSECPCVALREMEVLSTNLSYYRTHMEKKPVKIIAVIRAFEDADYYKCLTVGEFKKFLNNAKDKTEQVCIVFPEQLETGGYHEIINAWHQDESSDQDNERMRKITGNNIFHICF